MSSTRSGRRAASLSALLVVALVLGACQGADAPVTVARVVVSGIADSITVGDRRSLVAALSDASGGTLAGRTVAWSSSDTSVALVDAAGTVTAVAPGHATITATSEGRSGQLTVAVRRRPVAALTVDRASDTLMLGRTQTLRALPRDANGTTLTDRTVTWSVADSSVVRVAVASDGSATLSGVSLGTTQLVASSEGVRTTIAVTVVPVPVARLQFPSTSVTLAPGGFTTVAVSAVDAGGAAVVGAPLVYELASGVDVVRITPTSAADGSPALRLDALAAGSATVVVSADGQRATLAVTVTSGGATLHAYPESITAAPGALGRMSVAQLDAAGGSSAPAVTWSSTNPAVATVDATGRVSMVAVGTATFVATTAAGLTATVSVTVTPPPVSTFHIDIVPVGNVPQAVLDAATQAARRWQRVITTALPSNILELSANECAFGTPAVQTLTDGIIVYLMVRPIDAEGGTLAFAGPCAVREARYGGLPIAGSMTVDANDVSLLTGATGPLALDLLTHELGHVLGIGPLWGSEGPKGNLIANPDGDIRFIGPAASAATARLGLTPNATDGVPVEDQGGINVAGGHWRERVFLGELMTEWLNPAPNPLSVVTVQALHDLGYEVTETGADIVSPTSVAGGTALYSRSPMPGASRATAPLHIGERLLRPTFVVGPSGTRRVGPRDKQ